MFTDLVDMIDHKKYYCKLRFTCKCDMTHDGLGDCVNGAQCGGGALGEGKRETAADCANAECLLEWAAMTFHAFPLLDPRSDPQFDEYCLGVAMFHQLLLRF